jgi:branched-chain amino acid transport system permease protein
MTAQVVANALVVGCSAAILAIALSLVRSAVGFFDFSLAGIYTLAAYAAREALTSGVPPILAIIVAILTATAIAIAVHFALYEPLRRSGASPEVLLIASLSLLLILQNVIPLLFGDGILSMGGDAFRQSAFQFLGSRVTRVEVAIVVVAAVLTAVLLAVMRQTALGLQMRALAQDRDLSRTYGVRSERIIVSTVVMAAVLASAIGILSGFESDLTPTMGFRAVLLAAVAAVVGGRGNILGVFLGAVVVAGAQQMAALEFPVQWQDTLVFTCLIVFVIWRPNGIMQRRSPGVSE